MVGATAIREWELAGLGEHFHEDEIVELALVVAFANFTNCVNDAYEATLTGLS